MFLCFHKGACIRTGWWWSQNDFVAMISLFFSFLFWTQIGLIVQIIFKLFITIYKKTVNENSHKILINTDEATFQIINYILSKFFMCITYYDRDTNILLIDKITYLEVKEKNVANFYYWDMVVLSALKKNFF